MIAENLSRRNVTENRRSAESKPKVRQMLSMLKGTLTHIFPDQPIVLDAHLRGSLKSTRPSVSPEERARLSRMCVTVVFLLLRVLTPRIQLCCFCIGPKWRDASSPGSWWNRRSGEFGLTSAQGSSGGLYLCGGRSVVDRIFTLETCSK
jgi:hypothetical protein